MSPFSRRARIVFAVTCLLLGVVFLACGHSNDDGSTGVGPGPEASTPVTGDGAVVDGADGSVTPPVGTACGAPGAAPGYTDTRTVTWGTSGKGTYGLFLGSKYDGKTRLPVIFAFHGDGGDGKSMRSAGLEPVSEGGAIIVYPNGPNQTWDLETPADQNQDYAFFVAMVADVKATLCADPARVFAFGFSRGAFFANQVGCFEGDLLRATTSNSGGGPYSNDASDFDNNGVFICPKPAVAALIIHGTADAFPDGVPYTAGETARDHWQIRNGCATTTKPWGPSPCVTYDGCPAGHPVAWCSIPGMGHQIWSSTPQAVWTFISGL